MAGYNTPYPPDWKQQQRVMREQASAQRAQVRAYAKAQRQILRMQRRSSLVGPIFLIAIGIVFLLVETGRLQSYRVWEWYGQWWPLILLGAGLVALAEWGFDRFLDSTDRPAVHRSLGGLWVLFFFVVISGTAVSHARNNFENWPGLWNWAAGRNGDNWGEIFGNLHEMDQSFDETLPAGAAVSINSPRGGINISGTSTDGQMHIQLRREIYTNSDSDAADKARQLVPSIHTSGSQVDLSLPPVEGTQTSMTVTVPPSTQLNLSTNHGDIDISALTAPITLSSMHGDIGLSTIKGAVNARIVDSGSSFQAHNITGTVLLDTSGHDITITDVEGSATVRSRATGSTHMERITGSASYHSDRTQFDAARLDGQFDTNGNNLTVDSAAGPVSLHTYSYNIVLDRIGGNATIDNNNGTVDFSSASLGNVTIDNPHGNVTVTVPEHAAFTVEAVTRNNGEIFSDFSMEQQRTSGHGNTLHGTVGNGGSILRINTDRGDIALRKADLQPLPATAPPIHASTVSWPSMRSNDRQSEVKQSISEARANVREAMREVHQEAQEARREAEQERREARLEN